MKRATILSRLRRLGANRRGAALVEFALVFPVMLAFYMGSYTLSDAIACDRKVTVATRVLTDLATRYYSLTQADLSTILNASAQVMAPYPASNASIVLSEIQITDSTHGKVIWSNTQNGVAYNPGVSVTVPKDMAATGTYLICGKIGYTYDPAVNFFKPNPIKFSDSICMIPRLSDQVPLT